MADLELKQAKEIDHGSSAAMLGVSLCSRNDLNDNRFAYTRQTLFPRYDVVVIKRREGTGLSPASMLTRNQPYPVKQLCFAERVTNDP